jgi:hypothetical protein
MELVCPIDKKDDAIQKVSAILVAGISSGSFAGSTSSYITVDGKSGSSFGSTYLGGSSTTELARMLVPPVEPQPAIRSSWQKWLAVGAAVYFCVIPISLALAMGFFVSPEAQGNLVLNIIGVVILTGGLVFGSRYAYRKITRDEEDSFAQSQSRYAVEKPKWDGAIQKWNRIYYCHKHGIVFDPKDGSMCEPKDLKEFLYEPISG